MELNKGIIAAAGGLTKEEAASGTVPIAASAAVEGSALAAMVAALRVQPVATGSHFPFNSTFAATPGHQGMFRTAHYFPHGSKRTRLMYSGSYAGAVENDGTTGFPLKVGVSIDPAPWRADVSYQPGDQVVSYAVTYSGAGLYNGNAFFTCLVANTNSRPSPTNTDWAPATRAAPTPVTLDGAWDMTFGTRTLPGGATIAVPMLLSDPLPFIIPPGAWLGVYPWLACSGAQIGPADGQGQNLAIGPAVITGASVTDSSGSTALLNVASAAASQVRPAMIIGEPVTATEGVVLIGDSIGQGKCGGRSIGPGAVVNGGTGYKIGDILTYSNAGASAGAIAAGSNARCIVDNISTGGVIANLRSIDGGAYTDTTTQTGQTLPSGTQTLLGGSGTGATCSIGTSANCFDVGDLLGGQGFAQRALAEAGVPYVTFSSSGDRVNLWKSRARTRLAMIARSGATRAIVELGRNDLSAGDSAATILANYAWLVAALKGIGVTKVYGCTLTPETTSATASGQSTLADQMVTANDAQRQILNAALRSGQHPFGGILDIAAALESGGSSAPTGKFIVIGGLPCAADGKHPGPAGIALMQSVVATEMPALMS